MSGEGLQSITFSLSLEVTNKQLWPGREPRGTHKYAMTEINALLAMAQATPHSEVYAANMGRIWGRQDPGGPHVGPMNLAIWDEKRQWKDLQ